MSADHQIENDTVRVTRWTLAAGEETGPHRHELDYVVVPLATGRMHVKNADGSETENDLQPGASYFREAGAEHNVSAASELVDFVEVEVSRPAPGH